MTTTMKLTAAALVVGIGLGVALDRWVTTPKVQIVTREQTKTITVDRPVLQVRDVVRYVQDQTEATRLLAEAQAQREQIGVLTETVAQLRAQGAGTVQYVDRPVPGETRLVREVHFEDWRLTFDARDGQAEYSLRQKIEALAVVGKDDRGAPTATVRLFEVGPGETRTKLAAETTVIAARPDAPRWRASLALQAGAGYAWTRAGARAPGAVLAARWLTRGTSRAAEDGRVALLSPAVLLGSGVREVGLLPVSINFGRIPRQPARDLWVSPFVGYAQGTVGRVGVVITATF